MSAIVREVSQLSENETKEYTKLLAEAFEYRFFGDAFGNDKSLQEPIIEAQLNAAQIDGQGEIHVAELPGVGAVGVAIWFGPGRAFLSTDAQRNAGWMKIMEGLPVEYQLWWMEFSKEYEAVSNNYLGPGVKLGAYYLQLIGVSPDHQKKGVARALLQYGEAKARAQRVPCALDAKGAANEAIYPALGYTAAGSTTIRAPPGSDAGFDVVAFIKHTENECD